MVSSNGISFSGLGSGIDTAAIVSQLVALERLPIARMESQREAAQQKLDKISVLADLVKTLREKAKDLSKTTDLLSYAVDSSDPSVATFTPSGEAQPGTHSLEVLELAEYDRWAFDGVADPTVNLGSGSGQQIAFTIDGEQHIVNLTAGQTSLNAIRHAVEDQTGEFVDASIIQTGTENDPSYRLVLTSKESGEDHRITNIISRVDDLTIDFQAPDGNGDAQSENNITVGANSVSVVDGLTIERSSNEVADVVAGVQIDLLSSNEGQPMSFTVSADGEAIRGRIDDFVESYNDVIKFINKQSTYTPATDGESAGTSGVLFGDSLLKSVTSTLRSSLFDVDLDTVLNDTEGYSTLALIGITPNSDGTLEVDSETLNAKLEDNLQLFADLFTDDDGFDNGDAPPNTGEFYQDQTADSGLMATLMRSIDRLFGSFDGPIDQSTGERVQLDSVFDLKRETLRDKIRTYDDRITDMERRLDSYEQSLTLRFAHLEELMGSLNAQGAALSNALNQQ